MLDYLISPDAGPCKLTSELVMTPAARARSIPVLEWGLAHGLQFPPNFHHSVRGHPTVWRWALEKGYDPFRPPAPISPDRTLSRPPDDEPEP
jgi:hypothetical protein